MSFAITHKEDNMYFDYHEQEDFVRNEYLNVTDWGIMDTAVGFFFVDCAKAVFDNEERHTIMIRKPIQEMNTSTSPTGAGKLIQKVCVIH
jgi:hypothetical protein